ncbi:daptide-type RiPP biosynthesis methyltransferase [Amycolatopsis sp. cmx-11-12]|uniref:daptide-type RiPP biosynthesis methyltransferase n=1 Tax=Amycolatopsis sp. cmx-11-12 TaxID=2785795 RepID=UPI00391862BC
MTAVPGTAGRLMELYGLRAEPLYGPAGGAVYDRTCGQDTTEISEVLRLAHGITGPVLELACGAGRLTLPLGARGRQVVAVDNSPSLLSLLKSRLRNERISLVEADMTDFSLGRSFALIVLAAFSVTLLDTRQRASLFLRVRQHLAAGGVFYVSGIDHAETLTSGMRPAERVAVVVDDDSVITFYLHFDGRRRILTTSVLQEEVNSQVTAHRALFTSVRHMISSKELADEVRAAGLEVVEIRRGEPGEQVQFQLICRRAGAADE